MADGLDADDLDDDLDLDLDLDLALDEPQGDLDAPQDGGVKPKLRLSSSSAAAKHAKVLALLPGGLHDFDHVNAKSTPCISCQRVVGAGRAGVFCIACRRCRACAESLECEAGRTTTRIKNGSQVCSHSAHHLPRLALTAACDLGRLREA